MKDDPSPAASDTRQEALLAEYRAMAANVAEQRDRAERLQDLANDARAQAEAQESALRELGGLVGIGPQMSMDQQLDARLRGQRLQEIAIRVLAERHPEGEPIHYRQWYGLLREAGYLIGGKDPQATFLSSISRSPHVRSMGGRSGLYVIAGDGEDNRDVGAGSAAA
jgi:hypothetical protein